MPAPANGPKLIVLNTPLQGRAFPLASAVCRIGRSSECEVQLDFNSVSRVHARIERVKNGFRVQDLGSRNGIKVNRADAPSADLRHGDVLQVGEVEMRFETATEAAAPAVREEARPLTANDLLAAAPKPRPAEAEAPPPLPAETPRKFRLGLVVALGLLIALLGTAVAFHLVTASDETAVVRRRHVLLRVGEKKWVGYNTAPDNRILGDFSEEQVIVEDGSIADVRRFGVCQFLVIGKAGGYTTAAVRTERGRRLELRIIVRGRVPDPLRELEEARIPPQERQRLAEQFVRNGLMIQDEKPYLAMKEFEKALAVLRPLPEKGQIYLQAKQYQSAAEARIEKRWTEISGEVNIILKNDQRPAAVDLLTEALTLIPDAADPRHQKAAATRWNILQEMEKAEARSKGAFR